MICRICGRDYDIAADAVLLKRKFGIAMYLFPGPNGQVHEFRLRPHRSTKSAPVTVPTQPDVKTQALTELPQPLPELPQPGPVMAEFQSDSEPATESTMAYAFRNPKKF
jgi:hypothetical protein